MLSSLISLLRRIPAVNWAFSRLRPLPHGGSIDDAAVIAAKPVIVADSTEAVPALDTGIGTELLHSDAAVAADDIAHPVLAETRTDVGSSVDSRPQTPTEIEPVLVAEVLTSDDVASVTIDAPKPVDDPEPVIDNDPPVELSTKLEPDATDEVAAIDVADEPVRAAEPVISSDRSSELAADAEPDVAEETSSDPEVASVDAPALVLADDPSLVATADAEPAVDDSQTTPADREVSAEIVAQDSLSAEASLDSGPSSSAAMAIEPAAAGDPSALVAEHCSVDAVVVPHDEPAAAVATPVEEIRAALKLRARPAEPADRTALIRQRWAESGIRMWNPRLHGTGDATLNIQGSVGLLPPAPGETMPRYDKLEFRMLGGQIVCEGVIVEAPALASHRNFTRLAEPAKAERAREPVRERRAALA